MRGPQAQVFFWGCHDLIFFFASSVPEGLTLRPLSPLDDVHTTNCNGWQGTRAATLDSFLIPTKKICTRLEDERSFGRR